MSYTVSDRRGVEPQKEVCRVCGSVECHTAHYNSPTMKCIEYLRSKISEIEEAQNTSTNKQCTKLLDRLEYIIDSARWVSSGYGNAKSVINQLRTLS